MRQGETRSLPATQAGTVSIFAPAGRDAAVVSGLLREAGMESATCRDRLELARSLDDSTLFVVVTEEVMRTVDLGFIDEHLRGQRAWSDLPFIVLTRRGGGVE